jgi:hypothetical protein
MRILELEQARANSHTVSESSTATSAAPISFSQIAVDAVPKQSASPSPARVLGPE